MSLLDTASLIVTPNGYKEGKLYSVIPSDGSGDMSVTRATTATRVNAAGLVELVPYNLFQYSEQFNNASWGKYLGTLTSNATTAPNGTLTADLFTKTSAINTVSQVDGGSPYTTTGVHTMSVYIKPNVGNLVLLRLDNAGNTCNSTFNFSTLTFTNSGANFISSSYQSLPNGWYRLILTGNVTSTGWTISVCTLFSNPTNDSMYLWGAQLVEGTSALDYQATETRLNIPRLDYSNGSCPSLLVEPQRTNLLLYSSSFNSSPWAFGGVSDSVTPNAIISPDGTQNADTFVCGATGYSSVYQSVATTSGALYTFSVFAKKGNQNNLSIELRGVDTTPNIVFDLNSGTILSGSGGTITDAGNGWYRCTLTKLANSSSSIIIIGRGLSGSIGDTFNLYGAQLEAGNYSTSYIPTSSASVTRNADVISKTGISSLIGQTEGTLFFEGNVLNYSQARRFIVLYQDANNYITLRITSGNDLQFLIVSGGATSVNITTANIQGNIKMALAYNNNDFVTYLNGTQVGSDTSGSVPTTSDFYLGCDQSAGNQMAGGIKVSALWKERLTNAQLAQLTTI